MQNCMSEGVWRATTNIIRSDAVLSSRKTKSLQIQETDRGGIGQRIRSEAGFSNAAMMPRALLWGMCCHDSLISRCSSCDLILMSSLLKLSLHLSSGTSKALVMGEVSC